MRTFIKWFKVLFIWKWYARLRCHNNLFPCQLQDSPTDNQ